MRTNLITRAAEVRSTSFNEAANTVEVVFTTGATVRRWSPSEGSYDEELVVAPGSVRLERLNAGAPLLNTHSDYDLGDVIGSVVPGSARIENGRGVCTVLLSRREDVRGIVQDIRDGVLRNISAGYRYHRIEKTDGQNGDPAHWRVVDWEPLEISAVPIPADPGAQFRSLSLDGSPPSSTSAEATRARMRAASAAALPTLSRSPSMSLSYRRAEAITAALLHRSDPAHFQLPEDAREYRGMSLAEIAGEIVRGEGMNPRGLSRMEVIGLALAGGTRAGLHSSGDFTMILSNVANKTLRAGYEAAPQTFRPFTREVTAPDFKTMNRVQMGEAPQLEKVNEHGEFKRGSIGEGKESYAVLTYGKVVGITRQAIVNDDLGAFTRVATSMGVQAANLESDLVWAQIISNPVMGDGTVLFHASHNNLGTAAAITANSLALGIEAMRLQKGLDGRTLLNLSPRYLLHSVAAVMRAEQLLSSIAPNMMATYTLEIVPEYLRRLTPISEPRLDGGFIDPATGATVAGSRFVWFLAADPSQNDTVELAYLEGQRGVYTETRRGFDVDGVEVKVRLDAGAKVIDWRSFYKNPADAL